MHSLFPDEDYRFQMALAPGNLEGFFGRPSPQVLEERRRWLARDPGFYAGVAPGGGPLIREFESMAVGWGSVPKGNAHSDSGDLDRLIAFGGALEPDFLLLAPEGENRFRLLAGVVCFPSSWSLDEKLGYTLEEIHGVVPGLNPAIGAQIGRFLGKLRPGAPFERANWGLAATPELNLHPALARPRLGNPCDLSQVWLRIEDQIFAAMPEAGGILFGIRLRLIPYSSVLADEQLNARVRRAIATMPDDVADYKGIAPVRGALLAALGL